MGALGRDNIDIDRIVDYRAEYWAYVKKPRLSGDNLTGLCPFHDDRNNSFSVDLKTGKWHCLAEDIGGNFISFWAKIHGVDTKEAYKQILDKYGVLDEADKSHMGASRHSYTLKQYAFEKKLPEEWLKDVCHASTDTEDLSRSVFFGSTYLRLPYMDEKGKEVTYRKRFAHKEFRWRVSNKSHIGLYGEWRLPFFRQKMSLILVEGESDTQSLWYMGFNALGVPGAGMFKSSFCNMLQGFLVYLHEEPDQGGEAFIRKTVNNMKLGGFIGEVKKFSCSDAAGCKDPSDIFIKFGKDDGAKKIKALIEHAEDIDLNSPEDIPEAIKGAPIALRQPDGWHYSDRGITKMDEKAYVPVNVCRTPIILTRRLRSLDSGEEKIEIAYKRDGTWSRAIFPRSTIFTSRSVIALSDLGCTVTSENAKSVVRFLSALEAENMDVIGCSDSTGTFGWQGDDRFIPGRSEGIVLDVDASQRGMASAYTSCGTLEGWIETMRPHRSRDKFRFILAAGFAAPLLRIIRQRIFVIYNWGGSRSGKSITARSALSAWGDPERLQVNFNATDVGLERTAALFCDLPLVVDERQLAGNNQEEVVKKVYMIASGTGRLRGAKNGGVQHQNSWRTVALMTGEVSLTNNTTQTGVATRVLEIYNGPFSHGADDESTASLLYQQIEENYGHAGPAFINAIAKMPEDEVRSYYERMKNYINSVAKGKMGSHVAGIASVALADALIDTLLFGENVIEDEKFTISQNSWNRSCRMAKTILDEQMSAAAGDVNKNAVQFIADWVNANSAYFGEDLDGVCYGTIEENRDENIAYIIPSELNKVLERSGFDAKKTLRYMADSQLIDVKRRKDHDGMTYSTNKRFNGRVARFIKFYIDRVSEIDDEKKIQTEEQMSLDEFVSVGDGEELPFN